MAIITSTEADQFRDQLNNRRLQSIITGHGTSFYIRNYLYLVIGARVDK